MEEIKLLSVGTDEKVKIIHLHKRDLQPCICTEIGGSGICTETVVTNSLANRHIDNDRFVIYSREDNTDLSINVAASCLAPETDGCFGQAVICKMVKTEEGYNVTGLTYKEIVTIISAMGILEEFTNGSNEESTETVG